MRSPVLLVSTVALATLLSGALARADVKVGVTAAVNPQAIGQPPSEPERVLMVGTDNFANEKITTGPGGQLQLLFVDGSSISVGSDANLTIDQYVYDPVTKTGKLAVSAVQGVFRLVGGAISKSDEVTITTPIGTVGIRGGIAVVDSHPNQPMTAQFLFGNLLRVTANGGTQEATRPGFQITVLPGQPPLPPVRITNADIRTSLGQFQGRRSGGGQSGQAGQGGQEAPQDQALAQSGVSTATGSNVAPQTFEPAVTPFSTIFNPNTSNTVTNIVTQSSNGVQTAQIAQAAQSAGTQLFGAFYSDPVYVPGSFTPSTGFATYSSGNNGQIVYTLNGSTLNFRLPIGNGQSQNFSLPFAPGQAFATGPIPIQNGGVANGTVITASDASMFFAAYGTFTPPAGQSCSNGNGGGNGNCGFGFFGGVPTQATANSGFPTSGYATYNMIPVSTKATTKNVPFAGNLNTPAPGSAGLTVSPMYTVFGNPNPGTTSIGTNTQASLWIQGSGKNQSSGLIGMTSTFYQEQNATVAFSGGVVGMSRMCASCALVRLGSAASSDPIAPTPGSGLTNGNAIYGSNANYIVLGPDNVSLPPGAPGTVPTVRNSAASQDLAFDTQQSDGPNFYAVIASQASISASTFATRNTQTLQGYTGGLMDIRATNGTVTTGMFGSNGPNVFINTNQSGNTMGAAFGFNDVSTGDHYNLQFGNQNGNVGTRSAFINDLIFASRESRDANGNPLSTFQPSGGSAATVAFNRLFMVNSNVVPIDFQGFAGPGVTACTCAFMQWGWWIGEVQNTSGNSVREAFNLATWVAGVLAPTNQIPLTGTATYNGSAIGNVSVSGYGNYIAAGNFQQTWNFSSQSGSVMISNFDRNGYYGAAGLNLSGGVSASNHRDFSGGLSGPNSLSGSLFGSFYKNVANGDTAAGVGGNFLFNNSVYKAGGTFMGQR